MGGVMSCLGGPISTTLFTDDDESGARRLAAIVVWRRSQTTAPGSQMPPATLPPDDGWSSTRDDAGREVGYHRERRVVRALEREFPVPAANEALLLVIDEAKIVEDGLSIRVYAIPAPEVPRPVIDPALEKQKRLALRVAASRRESEVFRNAYLNHPAVLGLWQSASDDHAT